MPTALFLVVLTTYMATVLTFPSLQTTPQATGVDVGTSTVAAWQLAETGRPWMETAPFTLAGGKAFFSVGRAGHIVANRMPGQIWAAVPFYLVMAPFESRSGTQLPSGVPANTSAAVMTALAVLLLFLAIRSVAGVGISLGAAAILAFTTPMWTVAGSQPWTHSVTVLGIAGAAWAAARDRWWLAGVFLAFGITGRPHVALIAAVLGLGMSWARRSPWPAVKVGIPSLAGLGVLSLWSFYVFGTWDPRGGYTNHPLTGIVPGGAPIPSSGGHINFFLNAFGFFFSWDKGLFVWTPLLLVLLAAMWRGWRTAPAWTRFLAVGGLAYAAAQIGLDQYNGGGYFWGYRLALEPLVAVTPLAVATFPHAGRWARRLLPYVTAWQFATIAIYPVLGLAHQMELPDPLWGPNYVYVLVRTTPAPTILALLVLGGLWLLAWFFERRRAGRGVAQPWPSAVETSS